MRRFALVLLATGCVDHATLAVSTATLGCDWLQTHDQADKRWPRGTREGNPIIAGRPSVDRVDAYFAIAAVANVLLWSVLPRGWRSIAPMGVIAVEVTIVAGNAPKTGWCQ